MVWSLAGSASGLRRSSSGRTTVTVLPKTMFSKDGSSRLAVSWNVPSSLRVTSPSYRPSGLSLCAGWSSIFSTVPPSAPIMSTANLASFNGL